MAFLKRQENVHVRNHNFSQAYTLQKEVLLLLGICVIAYGLTLA